MTMHVSTSAQRNENRLTADDRARIAERIAGYLTDTADPHGPMVADTCQRLAAHSIGCSTDDLRDSELAEIAATVSLQQLAERNRRTAKAAKR